MIIKEMIISYEDGLNISITSIPIFTSLEGLFKC